MLPDLAGDGLSPFLLFLLFPKRLQKTLRHPLKTRIAMRGYPPCLHSVKLQQSMFRWTMRALAYVANLKSLAVPVCAHGLGCEPNRIPRPPSRQPTTTLRVAEVTELSQLFLRRRFPLVSWRRAVPTPPTPQRKAFRMQPGPVLQPFDRHEKRTSHQRFSREA
jgi:hypothetical protein